MTKPNSPSIVASTSGGSVRIVMLVIFLDLLGFGIVLPMVPYIVAMPQFLPAEWMMDALRGVGLDAAPQAVVIGLFSFAYSFCQFVMAPIWGKLSDRIGRRPVLVLSMAGYTFAWGMFAFAPDLNWLLLSRIFAGIASANIATAQAYMADVFPPEKRSKGMGLVGAAFGLGFTLGPPIGAGLMALGVWWRDEALGIALPIYVAMGLSAVAFVYALLKLPESLPPELRTTKKSRQSRFSSLAEAFKIPSMGPLLLAFFTSTFGFAILETLFSEFNRDEMKLNSQTNSLIFGIIGVVIVVVQGGLIQRLTKKYGQWKLLTVGLFLEGVCLIALPFSQSLTILIVVSCVMSVGNSLCNPSVMALISKATPSDSQGRMMGVSQSSSALGRILGPILGALVWAIAKANGYSGAQAAFIVGGVVVLVAIPIVSMAKRHLISHSTNGSALR